MNSLLNGTGGLFVSAINDQGPKGPAYLTELSIQRKIRRDCQAPTGLLRDCEMDRKNSLKPSSHS
jgi:hypothetical protein